YRGGGFYQRQKHSFLRGFFPCLSFAFGKRRPKAHCSFFFSLFSCPAEQGAGGGVAVFPPFLWAHRQRRKIQG
ncbi:MAG: hypothetical protein M0Z75_12940, partial [Nitrospiraceae bacterium]|nr:hypothetical protein [Nitrospiraceae bacterium]